MAKREVLSWLHWIGRVDHWEYGLSRDSGEHVAGVSRKRYHGQACEVLDVVDASCKILVWL